MTGPTVHAVAAVEHARLELEAHVRNLRRKLKWRLVRGEAIDDLAARIRCEEDLIRRMRRREV